MSCMDIIIIQAIQAVVWHHDIYMTGDEKDPGTNQLRDVLFGSNRGIQNGLRNNNYPF